MSTSDRNRPAVNYCSLKEMLAAETSAPVNASAGDAVVGAPTSSGQDDMFLPMLKIFYSRLFPVKEFYKWLSYGNGRPLPPYHHSPPHKHR